MHAIPNARLLWVAGLVFIPASTIVVYDAGIWRWVGALAMVVVASLAALDWIISRRLLAGVAVELPDMTRATKGREFGYGISFSNQGKSLDWIRYSISASPFFRMLGDVTVKVATLTEGKRVSVSYPMQALKRGCYFLDLLCIETPSVFNWWLIRRNFEIETEFRIYPDLSSERKRLASLFLMRGMDGSHLVRQVGKGRDFEQLREYQPGDDYTDIDWKATGRRQMPVTRTYQIEKTQEVYVVVDHSRLSGREIRIPFDETTAGDWAYDESSAGGEYLVTTQLEKFLHCSLVLASVAERQGDLFGFVSFANKVDRFIRGRNGKDHYNIVRDALYTLEPESVAPDFEQLMIALRQRLTRRALIVMLVDLSDPLTAEQFYEALPLINKQHLVLVNMVRPERAVPLFSTDVTPEQTSKIYENLAGHFQWQELRETANKLRHLGVELSLPEHEELCTEAVTQYLNVKNRQLI